jgi:hypothetical protein
MSKPDAFKANGNVVGSLKKRWSMAAILNRIGISESLVGSKEKYDEIVAKANEGVDESEQFKPQHPEPYMDLFMKKREAKRQTILTDFGGSSRALTARKDLAIR